MNHYSFMHIQANQSVAKIYTQSERQPTTSRVGCHRTLRRNCSKVMKRVDGKTVKQLSDRQHQQWPQHTEDAFACKGSGISTCILWKRRGRVHREDAFSNCTVPVLLCARPLNVATAAMRGIAEDATQIVAAMIPLSAEDTLGNVKLPETCHTRNENYNYCGSNVCVHPVYQRIFFDIFG